MVPQPNSILGRSLIRDDMEIASGSHIGSPCARRNCSGTTRAMVWPTAGSRTRRRLRHGNTPGCSCPLGKRSLAFSAVRYKRRIWSRGEGRVRCSAMNFSALLSLSRTTPIALRLRSAGNNPPDQVIANSNAPCSSRRSPRCTTPPVAPTTTENEPKERSTTPPSSASPDAAAMISTPCSRTANPIDHPP